jgi:hypothetical protein
MTGRLVQQCSSNLKHQRRVVICAQPVVAFLVSE